MVKANFIQVSVTTNHMVQLLSSDPAPYFISLASSTQQKRHRDLVSGGSPSGRHFSIDIHPEVCRKDLTFS